MEFLLFAKLMLKLATTSAGLSQFLYSLLAVFLILSVSVISDWRAFERSGRKDA